MTQTAQTVWSARALIQRYGSTYEAAKVMGVHESEIWNKLPHENKDAEPLITPTWRELSKDQKLDAVMPLAEKGLTALQIASELSQDFGQVPRSAVVGLCHRNNIELSYRRPRKPKRAVAGTAPQKPRAPRSPAAQKAKPAPAVVIPLKQPKPVPVHEGATIFELRDSMCAYPLWSNDQDLNKGRFCGKRREHGSFCAEHAAICYIPPEQRRRRAR